jgi:hypothetical protein
VVIEWSELERFGGREVTTTGDGLLATFNGPAQALRCAAAIRRAAAGRACRSVSASTWVRWSWSAPSGHGQPRQRDQHPWSRGP